ncbi:hypothetical protein [Pelagovum pacificum]|uniref:Sulfotransferase domain-containing protein n=1 Tax=Pelagovum pacificum TaxID=2588711 RepID=A0A5C5G9L3_9RHOB|nr:hypothetical protein [Pelagovum pacificum]QQA42287.1 hypothetical protein I8N54_16050 [Pelagovum pacificum]TNY31371.1 hypothetical protein FHY64_15240 [Pelagovum pacificum]
MNLPERLILHVGAHKTGTTHFQQGLRAGQATLEEAGCTIYTPPDLRPAPGLAEMLGIAFKGGKRDNWTPELLPAAAKGRKTLIISEENVLGQLITPSGQFLGALYPHAARRISAVVRAVAPVKPVLFLSIRDPASYVLSAYSQSLLGGYGGDFADFMARMSIDKIRWADLAAAIANVEGVASLRFWKLEDYPAVGSKVINRMASGRVADPAWLSHQASHVGLSKKAVEAALRAPSGPERALAAKAARAQYLVSDGHERFRPIDDETLALSAEFYEQEVAAMRALPGVRQLEPDAG